MKRFVGLLACICTLSSFAGQGVHILTCSTQGAQTSISTIKSTYSLLWPGLALSGVRPLAKNFSVDNRTNSGIAMSFGASQWVTPTQASVTQFYIAPSTSMAQVHLNSGVGPYVFIRADNTNNSNLTCQGDVFINAW